METGPINAYGAIIIVVDCWKIIGFRKVTIDYRCGNWSYKSYATGMEIGPINPDSKKNDYWSWSYKSYATGMEIGPINPDFKKNNYWS